MSMIEPTAIPAEPAAGAQTPVDTRVHLANGQIVHGAMRCEFQPGRDFRLRLYDRSEQTIRADSVRAVIHQLAMAHPVRHDAAPCFELRLTDDAIVAGQLHSAKALPAGLLLRATMDGKPTLIYSSYTSLVSLSVTPCPARDSDAGSTAVAPQSVAALSTLAEVKLYLEVLQGTQPPQEAFSAFKSASAQDMDELGVELCQLSARLGVPLVVLDRLPSPPPAADALPVPVLRRFGVLPLVATRELLAVAMSDPANQELATALAFLTPLRVVPMLASAKAIHGAINRGFDRIEDKVLLQSLGLSAETDSNEATEREAERLSREKPVVKMVSDIISEALHRRASDIHVRPGAQDVQLLYRIDGELVHVRRFMSQLLPAVIARIKVIGNMNLAEHRVPQDGRVSVTEAGQAIDLRISMMPTVYGESAVLRLLNTRDSLRHLEDLGLSSQDEQALRDLLERSHGMVLATGPTGCGKSTTLYAALLELRKHGLNIITVEDPVEYRIPEIEQVQVNRPAGTTFARTLRNVLRHDPDVIMVGEIRDRETAEIAVESALTGHLVLSTLHTNSAATSITRLLDLGLEAFLLRSTLLGVLAQRLARRMCPHCRTIESVPAHIRDVMGVGADEVFHAGGGCAACEGTGVHGRVAVYELVTVDATLRSLIQPGANADAIHAAALKQGTRSITEHAVALARAGVISLHEAFRVRVE